MILKYKYHVDSCRLEPFKNYTLAQYSGMADSVFIDFDPSDFDSSDYTYYLEFICYNHSGVPKARYASPMIYSGTDGLSFVLPACLTQYAGHVDMQLTGCNNSDPSEVFKSVSKYCKAFDVERSLGAIESEITDTPNIFTQIISAFDEFAAQCSQELESIKTQLSESLPQMLNGKNIYTVEFVVYGETVKKINVIEGSKLTQPSIVLPENCSVVDGWYEIREDQSKLWNFAKDTVSDNIKLTLNFATDGLVISDGKLVGIGKANKKIYVPEIYGGIPVTEIDGNIELNTFSLEFYMPSLMSMDCFAILKNSKVRNIYFPKGGYYKIRNDGSVYSDIETSGVSACMFIPRDYKRNVEIEAVAEFIGPYAISDNNYIESIIIPPTVKQFTEGSICNTNITSLTIPAAAKKFDDYAVKDNRFLKTVYLEGDCSQGINENTFVDTTVTPHARPVLAVQPQYYKNYAARNLPYQLKIIGQD